MRKWLHGVLPAVVGFAGFILINNTNLLPGPYRGGEFSAGLDSIAELGRLPPNYSGGIWTNEICLIAEGTETVYDPQCVHYVSAVEETPS